MTALEASAPFPMSTPATCSLHPDRPATFTCSRCGAFICDADRRLLGADVFCPTCVVRPDVDYLEAFRQSVWGKRDSWAWLVGIGAALNAFTGVGGLATGRLVYGVIGILAAVIGACYFLGMRWARVGLLATPPVAVAASLLSAFVVP